MGEQRPSRIRRILRALIIGLVIAAALLAVTHTVLAILGATREKAVRARWAQSMGSLEDFQKGLPVTGKNGEAKALESLAGRLGMGQEKSRDPWETAKGPVTDYLAAELEKPSPAVAPPPAAVASYLSDHSDAIASVRKQLLERAAPVWESRGRDFYDAPIPGLITLLGVQKTLAAEALSAIERGEDGLAAEDLEASWRLHLALAGRPEMISAVIDMALLRYQAGVLRKLSNPSPAWRERLGAVDPGAQLLRGYKLEACAILEAGNSTNWTRVVTSDPGVHHGIVAWASRGYVRLCAAEGADTLLDMVELLRASDPCATDTKERVDEIVGGIPRWNFFARIALPNLATSWGRADRMKLDLELTDKVLQAREARSLNGGRWPEALPGLEASPCAGERWTYTLTPERVTLAFSGDVRVETGKTLVLPRTYEEDLAPEKSLPAHR